jgi:hypothetical protein
MMPRDDSVRHVPQQLKLLLARHAMVETVVKVQPVVNATDVLQRPVQRFEVRVVLKAALLSEPTRISIFLRADPGTFPRTPAARGNPPCTTLSYSPHAWISKASRFTYFPSAIPCVCLRFFADNGTNRLFHTALTLVPESLRPTVDDLIIFSLTSPDLDLMNWSGDAMHGLSIQSQQKPTV